MFKQIVGVLLVSVLFSCQSREREQQKIVTEVQRLELLRTKAAEFLVEQEANTLVKKFEYEVWKAGQVAKINQLKKKIETAQSLSKNVKKILEEYKNAKGYDESIKQQLREGLVRDQRVLRDLPPKYAAAQKEFSAREPVFLRQIKKMEADLKITQATYDSLNALHTIEVGKLARFGSEQ